MNVQRRDPLVKTISSIGTVLTWKFAEAIFPIHFVANWSNHIRVQIYYADQSESNVYESSFMIKGLNVLWNLKALPWAGCGIKVKFYMEFPVSDLEETTSISVIIKPLFDIQPTCLMVHQLVPLYRTAETQQEVLFNAVSLNITSVMRRIHTISSFFIS